MLNEIRENNEGPQRGRQHSIQSAFPPRRSCRFFLLFGQETDRQLIELFGSLDMDPVSGLLDDCEF